MRIKNFQIVCLLLIAQVGLLAQKTTGSPDFEVRFEDQSKLTPYSKQKIYSIKATSDKLWVGTDKGLFQVSGNKNSYVPVIQKSAQYYIQHIYQDPKGKIWVANHTNLVADLNGNQYRFVHKDGTKFQINSIHFADDNLWIGGSKGTIMRFNIETDEIALTPSSYKGNVNSILSQNGKIKLAARDNGCFHPNPKSKSGWDLFENVKSANKVIETNGNYWLMGKDQSGQAIMLNSKNMTNWKDLTKNMDCFPLNNIEFYDFDLDPAGKNLWIGSDRGIIHYNLKSQTCNLYSKKSYPNLGINVIDHISVQNDSTVWVASEEGKLYKMTIIPIEEIIEEEEEIVEEEIVEGLIEEVVVLEENKTEETQKQASKITEEQASNKTEVIEAEVVEVEVEETPPPPPPKKKKVVKKKSLVNFDDIQCNETLELSELYFLPNTASFIRGKEAGEYLDILVAYMDAYPNADIELYGHTDFLSDNKEYLTELSQKRVDRVKKYLNEQGIKKNRIKTEAFGGDEPIITDRVSEDRASNRRVEVLIICD